MLELDECNQLLVTNPFADDTSTVSPSNTHDALVTLTLNPSSEHHPLRSRSVSPACRCNTRSIPTVTVVGSEDETPPRLTRVLSLDGSSPRVAADSEEGGTTGSEASRGGGDVIIHPVRPFRRDFHSAHLLFNHRSVRTTLLLASPSAMTFLSLPFVVPTKCGHPTRSISVLSF